MIVIPRLRLGYQSVPKVASTTLTEWLYALCADEAGEPEALKGDAMRRYFSSGREGNVEVANTPGEVAPYAGFLRFAVTRDPVQRFLSMYANRVVHYRELSAEAADAPALRAAGLPFDPEINLLVRHLEDYLAASPVIRHHTLPMMHFMGPDVSVFDEIVDISGLAGLVGRIIDGWRAAGLGHLADRAPKLPRRQTGGPKLSPGVLQEAAFERLLQYYAEDYATLPTVDIEAARRRHAEARANPPPLIEIHAPAIVAECLVRHIGGGTSGAEGVDLAGFVVLKPDVDRGDWSLRVRDANGERPVAWRKPSAQTSARHPGNPNGKDAHFVAKGVRVTAEEPAILVLVNRRKGRQRVATLRPVKG